MSTSAVHDTTHTASATQPGQEFSAPPQINKADSDHLDHEVVRSQLDGQPRHEEGRHEQESVPPRREAGRERPQRTPDAQREK